MKRFKNYLLLISVFILVIVSCKKDNSNDNAVVNQQLYDLMKEIYLWYDHLPVIDPASYATPYDLMDALRYNPPDKWSFVMTKTEYNQYFQEGVMIGHGISLGVDANENIRIAFVYRSTQAYNEGVRRGWIISKVNGTTATTSNVFDLLGPSELGVTNNIEFLDSIGHTVDLSLSKQEVNITPVLLYKVIDTGTEKVGYLVFQDFIDAADPELDEAFNYFKTQGINDMIVDMRYNGGGSVNVAQYLAGWLIGKNYGNQSFVSFMHNNKYTSWDTTLNIPNNANGLDLNRLFFIGTRSTASASELVINGMKPYVESILAGDSTDGKPVGMYAFPFKNYNYVVLPISFRYTNADGVGDFYEGLIPSIYADDDLTKNFGDPAETSLNAVLSYIEGNPPAKAAQVAIPARILTKKKPINEFLKAY